MMMINNKIKQIKKGGVYMKKSLVLVFLISMLLLAASAQAATKVHGDFGTDSSGCAKCHITHAAEAAKLLLTGTNQTDFCFSCHGTTVPGAPYDVKDGAILGGAKFDYTLTPIADWMGVGTVLPSYTGGFAKSYDFEGQTDVAMDPGAVGGAKFKVSTSAHNVQTVAIGQAAWNSGVNKIPGGSATVFSPGVFTCSSCHDPHGYNSSTAGGGVLNNPRLLRHDLPARSNVDVSITIDVYAATVGLDTGNMTDGTLRTTGYPDATLNKWCGGCHDLLDVGKNAGSDKGAGPDTRYRHAMGIALPTTVGVTTSIATGTPLATGNKLLCISCHRVHGTAASMTALANTWTGQDYNNLPGANVSKSGTALLRLSNRNVCYNCHGAAQRNTNTTSGAARAAVTY